MKYWRRHPPAHITLAAFGKAWSGRAGRQGRSTDAPPATNPDGARMSAMEGVAAVLGPPTHKFRPPCRMQTSAPETDPQEAPNG